MAKKSKIAKNLKIKQLRDQKRPMVVELRQKMKDKNLSLDERDLLSKEFFRKIPRKARGNQYRERCELTGRPRGNFRRFKMCRIKIREFAAMGLIPGLRKASW